MNSTAFLLIAFCLCDAHDALATEEPTGPSALESPTKRRTYHPLYTSLLKQLVTEDFHPSADIVLSLLNSKADPNITNAYGRSILHHAAMYGNEAIVKATLRNGADPNSRDALGRDTPLMLAKTPEIAQHLLDYNANLHELDSTGKNVLYDAVMSSYDTAPEVVAVLCNAGIHVNQQDRFGSTPLHHLFVGISPTMATLQRETAVLLFKGADHTMVDQCGKTPLDVLQAEWPKQVPSVQAVIAAASLVKKEKEDAYRKILTKYLRLLEGHLSVKPMSIVTDYANSPPWNTTTCWPLFEKHMKKQRRS